MNLNFSRCRVCFISNSRVTSLLANASPFLPFIASWYSWLPLKLRYGCPIIFSYYWLLEVMLMSTRLLCTGTSFPSSRQALICTLMLLMSACGKNSTSCSLLSCHFLNSNVLDEVMTWPVSWLTMARMFLRLHWETGDPFSIKDDFRRMRALFSLMKFSGV